MTARVPARATAVMAALLLVLGMTIVAMSLAAEGEIAYVPAAQPSEASPNGTGNACPPASPQGEDADPSCGNEGNAGQGKGDKGDTGSACPPSSPNAGGAPPCGDDGDDGEVDCDDPANADDPACDDGEVDCDDPANADDPACDDGEVDCDDPANADDPTCDDGEVDCDDPANADDPTCDDGGVDTQRCDTPDGIELLDDGTLAKFLHDNDPLGLSSEPVAGGPLSGAVYEGGEDTPLSPVTDEVGCLVSLTGAL